VQSRTATNPQSRIANHGLPDTPDVTGTDCLEKRWAGIGHTVPAQGNEWTEWVRSGRGKVGGSIFPCPALSRARAHVSRTGEIDRRKIGGMPHALASTMKTVAAIKDYLRWAYLGLTFLGFLTLEVTAIYFFYKAIGVI
jgi:hypothetical protein